MNQFQQGHVGFNHSMPTAVLASHLDRALGRLDPMVDGDVVGRQMLANRNPPPLPAGQLPLHRATHYGFFPASTVHHQLRHPPPPQYSSHQQQLYQRQRQLCDPSIQLPHSHPQPHQPQAPAARHYQQLHHHRHHQPGQVYAAHQLQLLNSLPVNYHQIEPQFQPVSVFPSALHSHITGPVIMAESDPHDMAAQQEAAKDYQPVHEGPAVGSKTSIDTITNEYVKADPVYVEKTMALPQTYSHYRPVKGDGNCGWRAIGFSYFEKLVEAGDRAQIEGEVARLTSMNQMLGNVGGYTYYEDWADEAIGLLRELAGCISDRDAARTLVNDRWNDIGVASGLIYYLRLLAATYLKANSAEYDPFVPDGSGIHSYCSQSIELIDREIEQLGIIALVNVLLKPVDFVLEIAYLDRSPGSTVNVYRFPEEANGKDASTLGHIIYLLYRPDHYDILYRQPSNTNSVTAPTEPVNIQVNRVATPLQPSMQITSAYDSLGLFATGDIGALAMIPGFSTCNPSSSSMSSLAVENSPLANYTQEPYTQDRSWMMPPLSGPSSAASAPSPASSAPGHMLPLRSHVKHAGDDFDMPSRPTPLVKDSTVKSCNFRRTAIQLEYDDNHKNDDTKFQVTTTSFKNSVYNRAHFGNPDFHPEEWTPEDEIIDARVGSRPRGPVHLSWI